MGTLPRPELAPGPHRALVDALHDLHHRAGWPSLRSLARDAGCSHTTVSHVFSQPRLPSWGAVEVLVIDGLVAVVAQQVRGRIDQPQADDVLAQFLEFGHQGREVAVPRDDHERVDVRLAPGKVHRVDDQPDVGRILARLGALGDLDQLDRRLVERGRVVRISAPVCVRLLDDQLPLLDQPFQHLLDVELDLPLALEPHRQVFQVDEDGQVALSLMLGF